MFVRIVISQITMDGVVLCEIADEVPPESPEDPTEFRYGKRRWVFKDNLVEHKEEILICIEKCV